MAIIVNPLTGVTTQVIDLPANLLRGTGWTFTAASAPVIDQFFSNKTDPLRTLESIRFLPSGVITIDLGDSRTQLDSGTAGNDFSNDFENRGTVTVTVNGLSIDIELAIYASNSDFYSLAPPTIAKRLEVRAFYNAIRALLLADSRGTMTLTLPAAADFVPPPLLLSRQTIQLPNSRARRGSAGNVTWSFSESRGQPIIAEPFTGNSTIIRTLQAIEIHSSGKFALGLDNNVPGFTQNADLSSLFENQGVITITVGSMSLVINMSDSTDNDEPYQFTPSNSAEVITFYRFLQFDSNSNLEGTLTLSFRKITSEDIPTLNLALEVLQPANVFERGEIIPTLDLAVRFLDPVTLFRDFNVQAMPLVLELSEVTTALETITREQIPALDLAVEVNVHTNDLITDMISTLNLATEILLPDDFIVDEEVVPTLDLAFKFSNTTSLILTRPKALDFVVEALLPIVSALRNADIPTLDIIFDTYAPTSTSIDEEVIPTLNLALEIFEPFEVYQPYESLNNAMRAPSTDAIIIALLSISTTTAPVNRYYLSSDNTQILPSTRVLGTVSRGQEYLYLPFKFTLPNDEEDSIPQAMIVIDNVSSELSTLLSRQTAPLTITIELVTSLNTDIVEYVLYDFVLRKIEITQTQISATLTVETLDTEVFPAYSFSPSDFPGLFKS